MPNHWGISNCMMVPTVASGRFLNQENKFEVRVDHLKLNGHGTAAQDGSYGLKATLSMASKKSISQMK